MIPGGNIFEIDTVTEGGSTGTDWTVNVKEGTQLLLAMSDTPKGGWGTGGRLVGSVVSKNDREELKWDKG